MQTLQWSLWKAKPMNKADYLRQLSEATLLEKSKEENAKKQAENKQYLIDKESPETKASFEKALEEILKEAESRAKKFGVHQVSFNLEDLGVDPRFKFDFSDFLAEHGFSSSCAIKRERDVVDDLVDVHKLTVFW